MLIPLVAKQIFLSIINTINKEKAVAREASITSNIAKVPNPKPISTPRPILVTAMAIKVGAYRQINVNMLCATKYCLLPNGDVRIRLNIELFRSSG